MVERIKIKEQSMEVAPADTYEMAVYQRKKFIEQQRTGKIVIHDSDREWEPTKQGRIKYYLQPFSFTDHVSRDWYVFSNDIRKHSGSHRHQGGGVTIFVLEGKGYTVIDGEQFYWEEGDLILLPCRSNGVVHQHFNTEPGKSCKWVAFIYLPFWNLLLSETTQVEVSPDYRPKV